MRLLKNSCSSGIPGRSKAHNERIEKLSMISGFVRHLAPTLYCCTPPPYHKTNFDFPQYDISTMRWYIFLLLKSHTKRCFFHQNICFDHSWKTWQVGIKLGTVYVILQLSNQSFDYVPRQTVKFHFASSKPVKFKFWHNLHTYFFVSDHTNCWQR